MSRTTIKEYVIAAGAGYTDIPLTIPCRHATIEEVTGADTGAFAPGYLDVKRIEDNFATNHYISPATSLEFGNQIAEGNAFGPLLGDQGETVAAYAGGTIYQPGDRVLSGGVCWICIKANTLGVAPAEGANWNVAPFYRAPTVIAKIHSQDASQRVVRLTQTE